MIVVEFVKMEVANLAFLFQLVKYMIARKRLIMDCDKIHRVYPEAESFDDVQNKDVIANHQRLFAMMEKEQKMVDEKLKKYYDKQTDLLEKMFD